ncbi:MAG: T9SS type A sorting domain-containing protein [Bacteroidota bacterium]
MPVRSASHARSAARRRLAWLRRAASAGTLTLAMLHGTPAATAQSPPIPEGGELRVNNSATGFQDLPAVAMDDDGDFVIAWEAVTTGSESTTGILARLVSAAGLPQGSEFRVNTATGNKFNPAVAMDADGDFVVAWHGIPAGETGFNVSARRYAANGTPLGGEFLVSTFVTDRQDVASVAMSDAGAFVVAWEAGFFNTDGPDGSERGIFARRYDANGNPQGNAFQVNTFTTGTQRLASVAMDADGDFVVVWQSENQDGMGAFGYGIFAQRYAADGMPQGGEFQVNTYTTGSQLAPAVAMDDAGNFVVAWSSTQDGTQGVYAQQFSALGVPLGGEFEVNTFTASIQNEPSVAMDANGDFVIAWQSYTQDSDGAGIYARAYAFDGTPLGSEVQANTYTTDDQRRPAVAMDADGDFVVAWQSDDQRSDEDVFAQRFTAGVIPVELTRFDAVLDGEAARLSWATASETVNAGFEVQRQAVWAEDTPANEGDWAVLDFVPSAVPSGTTSEPQTYAFTDAALPLAASSVRYRLRQVDFDGTFAYSPEVEVVAALPTAFALDAVYPNPTRAEAAVTYALPTDGLVRLAVYDALGREVAVLHDGPQVAGRHRARLATAGLSTGIYVVCLETNRGSEARRVTVLR